MLRNFRFIVWKATWLIIGKSKSIFNELEEQYPFVGGSEQDYVKYLRRDDIPAGMWHYIPLDNEQEGCQQTAQASYELCDQLHAKRRAKACGARTARR